MISVPAKKLHPKAILPTYANDSDAGADLYSIESGILWPGQHKLIDTGIAVEIPVGWAGFVHPRSGIAAKFGITIVNSPGTIDSGYRGSIKVNLINLGQDEFRYAVGDRIAQIVFQQVALVNFVEVDSLENSVRGVNGHGSTGGFNASRI